MDYKIKLETLAVDQRAHDVIGKEEVICLPACSTIVDVTLSLIYNTMTKPFTGWYRLPYPAGDDAFVRLHLDMGTTNPENVTSIAKEIYVLICRQLSKWAKDGTYARTCIYGWDDMFDARERKTSEVSSAFGYYLNEGTTYAWSAAAGSGR